LDVDRKCSVCLEEAPMFCRMCNLHYCPDHLCLHLNVAWEENTWTRRNSSEQHDNDSSRIRESLHGTTYDEDTGFEVQATPKPLPAYTEAQLQAQYNFYLSQARRIRIELERRCLPLSGAEEGAQKRPVSWERLHSDKRKPRKTLPKSTTYAVELLLNRLRSGALSLEDIRTGIGIAQMRAAKKNS
jgi:hypothetical protein